VAVKLIDLNVPNTWPRDVLDYLGRHHALFLDWETRAPDISSYERAHQRAKAYDRAIYGLRYVLQPYAITGWHCTRLTQAEIATIISNGMQLPDAMMLSRRIDALLNDGLLDRTIASRLKNENQADERYRAGMVWFCFFPPGLAGESGIERFFRHWGGKALYNSHEDDPETGVAIESIGVPCVVEADVLIANLEPAGGLDFKVVRRFLIHRGYRTREPVEHEDHIIRPLPAGNIRRVICFPDPEFIRLTGCDSWDNPIGGESRSKVFNGNVQGNFGHT
jgi:hypothetical protein